MDALARLLHESGRRAVERGENLAQQSTFVEWADLHARVKQGRAMTASAMSATPEPSMPPWSGAIDSGIWPSLRSRDKFRANSSAGVSEPVRSVAACTKPANCRA